MCCDMGHMRGSAACENGSMTDVDFNAAMDRALSLAEVAASYGDVPCGAVVVGGDGQIVGEGFNERTRTADPLAHAEVLAMQQAASNLGKWNLEECTLVVNLEPCPMCAGAAVMGHVGRIVFGAWDSKMGACGSVWDIPRDPHVGFFPEIIGGVKKEESAALLREFFAKHRSR